MPSNRLPAYKALADRSTAIRLYLTAIEKNAPHVLDELYDCFAFRQEAEGIVKAKISFAYSRSESQLKFSEFKPLMEYRERIQKWLTNNRLLPPSDPQLILRPLRLVNVDSDDQLVPIDDVIDTGDSRLSEDPPGATLDPFMAYMVMRHNEDGTNLLGAWLMEVVGNTMAHWMQMPERPTPVKWIWTVKNAAGEEEDCLNTPISQALDFIAHLSGLPGKPWRFKAAAWNPLKESKGPFKERITKDFATWLEECCRQIEKKLEHADVKIVKRTPSWAPEHFEWLVRHLIVGESSDEIGRDGQVDRTRQTVDNGVSAAAETLVGDLADSWLSLRKKKIERKPPRTN